MKWIKTDDGSFVNLEQVTHVSPLRPARQEKEVRIPEEIDLFIGKAKFTLRGTRARKINDLLNGVAEAL